MFDTTSLGKWIIFAGIALVVFGGLVWLVGRSGLPLGRLPGDIRIERDGFVFFFPLASCIVASIVMTILLNIVVRLLNR